MLRESISTEWSAVSFCHRSCLFAVTIDRLVLIKSQGFPPNFRSRPDDLFQGTIQRSFSLNFCHFTKTSYCLTRHACIRGGGRAREGWSTSEEDTEAKFSLALIYAIVTVAALTMDLRDLER